MARTVMHVDLDAFYASVEQRDNPVLKGKPVVVCMFTRGGKGGAVATASYEARKLGVKSGMPLSLARSKAPDAEYVKADIGKYKAESDAIMAFLRTHAKDGAFEQMSIDEAYLEVADANAVIDKIHEWMAARGLSCSIGVASGKVFSKIAAKMKKPNGVTIVPRGKELAFLAPLQVGDVPGIGGVAEEKLAAMGVKTVGEMARLSLEQLVDAFGNSRGSFYYNVARGVDDSPVAERGNKEQSGRLVTLEGSTRDKTILLNELGQLAKSAADKVAGVPFKRVSIVVVFNGREYVGRQRTLAKHTTDVAEAMPTIEELLNAVLAENPNPVRRIGISLSGLLYAEEGKERAGTAAPASRRPVKKPQKNLADY